MSRADTIATQGGFSLVEVLVALIVIAVGLLGIAKLQALALSVTAGSRTRALAALEAASLAATMHADRDYWSATPAASITINDLGSSASVTTTDATLQPALSAVTSCKLGATGTSAPCSPVNMAANDLNGWARNMDTVMRGSTAAIACANTNNVVSCTITVNWQENMAASNAAESSRAFQNQTYQLVVEP
jgi:type IV pilus assembly protein PilV